MDDKNRYKKVTFTIPPETDVLLRELARISDLKMSTIIKKAVDEYAKKFYEGATK